MSIKLNDKNIIQLNYTIKSKTIKLNNYILKYECQTIKLKRLN